MFGINFRMVSSVQQLHTFATTSTAHHCFKISWNQRYVNFHLAHVPQRTAHILSNTPKVKNTIVFGDSLGKIKICYFY